jgi:hypothetical protein
MLIHCSAPLWQNTVECLMLAVGPNADPSRANEPVVGYRIENYSLEELSREVDP